MQYLLVRCILVIYVHIFGCHYMDANEKNILSRETEKNDKIRLFMVAASNFLCFFPVFLRKMDIYKHCRNTYENRFFVVAKLSLKRCTKLVYHFVVLYAGAVITITMAIIFFIFHYFVCSTSFE